MCSGKENADLHLMDLKTFPHSKVHGANMGPTWALLAPDGPHVGPMNLAIRVVSEAKQSPFKEAILLCEDCSHLIQIVLIFIPKDPIKNKSTLVR